MAGTQTPSVPGVGEEGAGETTNPTIDGSNEKNIPKSKEMPIPPPRVFSLSEAVTKQFAKNGDFDMVFAMRMNGSFDVYSKRINDKTIPVARMNMQDQSKKLYEVFKGPFELLEEKKPCEEEEKDLLAFEKKRQAQANLILKDRFTQTTIPIAWSTIDPIDGVPNSNCGTASAFGYCWVTP